MKHSSFRFLTLILLALLALSIPFALILSRQSQQLTQYAQTIPDEIVSIYPTNFAPTQLSIAAGTTVVWINQDPVTVHTSTSDAPLGTTESWSSGGLGPKQSYGRTFYTPGTYSYHDALHPEMTAEIIVTASLVTFTPVPSGTVLPTQQATTTPSPTESYNCLGACITPSISVPSVTPTAIAATVTPMISDTQLQPTETPIMTDQPPLDGDQKPPTTFIGLLLQFLLTFLTLLLSLIGRN